MVAVKHDMQAICHAFYGKCVCSMHLVDAMQGKNGARKSSLSTAGSYNLDDADSAPMDIAEDADVERTIPAHRESSLTSSHGACAASVT